MKKKFLILFFCSIFVLSVFANQVIYVDQNASGANNGTSWADAYTTISNALADITTSDSNTILIASGVYSTFSLGVSHSGIYNGTNVIKGYTNGVVIDGGGSAAEGITLQDTKYVRIENMTIRNVSSDGIYFFVAKTNVIYRIVIYGVPDNAIQGQGASYNKIINCTFWSNKQGTWASGDSYGTSFENCIFQDNWNWGIDWNATGASIDYCNMYNNNSDDYHSLPTAGPHDISADSLFVSNDPSSPNFLRLSSGSPCIGKASDGGDIGAFAYSAVSANSPNAPTGVTTTTLSTNSIKIQWDDVSNETSFTLYRSLSNDTNSSSIVIGLVSNITIFTDKNLSVNTTYYYWVKAFNTNGSSPFSTGASAKTFQSKPAVPTWNTVTSSATQIIVKWNDVATETNYILYKNTANNTNTVSVLASVSQDQTVYTDNTVSSGVTYFYWLKSQNSGGLSAFSSVTQITTPSAPAPQSPSVIATAISSSEIDIIWNDISTATCYTLFRALNNDTNSVSVQAGLLAHQTNFNDTGLSVNTTYYYWIKAYNSSGASGFSVVSFATTSGTSVPVTPTWVSGIAVSTTEVDLIWHNQSNETSYTLYRSLSNSTNASVVIQGFNANITNYNDTGLSANTTYYYYVKAFNSFGASSFSSPMSVSTIPLGNIIYVSKMTNSPISPYNDPSHPATSITDALAVATNPTNTIMIIDNYNSYDSFNLLNKSNITIEGGQGYLPTINGTNRIFIQNSHNIKLKNISRKNTNSSDFGIFIELSHNITIENCEFATNQLPAIVVGNLAYNNDIISNSFYDNVQAAIQLGVGSYSNIIEGNQFFNNQQMSLQFVVDSHNNEVKNNWFFDNNSMAIQFVNDVTANVVESNFIFRNQSGVQFGNNCNQNILRGNSIYSNTVMGIQFTGDGTDAANQNILVGNYIWGNQSGIQFDMSSHNNEVKQNYIYKNTSQGVIVLQSSLDNSIMSNSVYSNQTGIQILNVKRNDILGNKIYENQFQGMNIQNSTNILCSQNEINQNQQQGILLQWAVSNRLSQNNIHNNGLQGILVFQANNNSFVSNQIHSHANLPAIALGGTSGTGSDNNLLSYNLFWTNYWGVFIEQGSANNVLNHNTFFNNSRGLELNNTGGNNNVLKNSIIANSYGDFGIMDGAGTLIEDYNDVFNSSVANYQGLTAGSHSIQVDPIFISTDDTSQVFLYIANTSGCANSADDGTDMGALSALTSLNPARVSNIIITPLSTTSLKIDWQDLNNETSYTLYRNTTNDTNSAIAIQGLNENQTIYTDSGLIPESVYYYWVKGFNNFGKSPISQVSFATTESPPPSTPTGFGVTLTNGIEMNLYWNDVASETGYAIYRALSNDTNSLSLIVSVASNIVKYKDENLAEHTRYYYWIKAFRRHSYSPFSLVTSASTTNAPKPPAPTLSASSLTYNTIQLQWDKISVATSYTLYRSTVIGTNNGSKIKGVWVSQTNYIDSGLSENTTYYYWIKSYNSKGSSAFSTMVNATTKIAPPTLSLSTVDSESATLQWNDLSNETSYTLYKSEINNSSSAVAIVGLSANTTMYVDANLQDNKIYYYWIKAFGLNIDDDFSAVLVVKTQPKAKGFELWNNHPENGQKTLIYVVSPNPAQHQDDIVTIRLYSITGVLVKEILSVPYSEIANPILFDTSFLDNGTYIIFVKGADIKEYKRLYIEK